LGDLVGRPVGRLRGSIRWGRSPLREWTARECPGTSTRTVPLGRSWDSDGPARVLSAAPSRRRSRSAFGPVEQALVQPAATRPRFRTSPGPTGSHPPSLRTPATQATTRVGRRTPAPPAAPPPWCCRHGGGAGGAARNRLPGHVLGPDDDELAVSRARLIVALLCASYGSLNDLYAVHEELLGGLRAVRGVEPATGDVITSWPTRRPRRRDRHHAPEADRAWPRVDRTSVRDHRSGLELGHRELARHPEREVWHPRTKLRSNSHVHRRDDGHTRGGPASIPSPIDVRHRPVNSAEIR
jgi:hypothetical protein